MENRPFCPKFIRDIISKCKSHSNKIAVIDNLNRQHTYSDFLDVIERTSGYIIEHNIPQKSFILICLPNSMEYLAAEYGIWLAGCTIVPVNPEYPKERIDYIAKNCESPLIIDDRILEEIRNTRRMTVCNVQNDIAALFYTSGSTGKPKGVIHTFDSLKHIDYFNEIIIPSENDIFGIGSPLSFIASVLTIPFLRRGACICLISKETMRDANKLQQCFDNDGITSGFLSPSILRQLNLKNNRTLKTLFTGSERVSDIMPESNYRLINMYGMTETSICFHFDITSKFNNTPIGKPTSDTEVRIAEDGEICLRGRFAPGYYKNPEASAELWRDGWLHTGDIGRMLPDGNIEYVNRKDWMIKINGQRVETGEISEVIKETEGVENAIAKGFHSADGHPYIVGYYVAANDLENEIRDYISTKLAPYMIPAYLVRMDKLPLNANGKIDVKSLQSPVELGLNNRRVAEAETPLQKKICAAFETALGISLVGIDDDFIKMGGDSIRVMQVQTSCPDLNINAEIIYRLRTVRLIAEELSKPAENEDIVESYTDYPLSTAQTGIFVECMNHRGEISYNNPFLYKLPLSIDADKLAKSCSIAVSAHPNLFAEIFMDDSGKPRQRKTECSFTIQKEIISDNDFELLKSHLLQTFDILSDRLFRIRIFQTKSSNWLFMDFHHIVFDGTSNEILIEDIEKAYDGGTIQSECLTGFDIAFLEQKKIKTPFYEQCKEWYLGNFSSIDNTSLPDPDVFQEKISFATLDIPTGISSDLFHQTSSRLGFSENILSTASFGYMLGACSHACQSAFATIYNGRKSLKTERTISMMVKTLPVICQWDKQTTIGDYLTEIRTQLTGSMANDLYGFSELCAATSFDSRVIFTYQDELLERESLCGEDCKIISLLANATGEPLAVQLYKKEGQLYVRAEYRSNMFSSRYIKGLIECFNAILLSLTTSDKKSLTLSLRLITKKQLEEVLSIGKGKTLDYNHNETFVDMFERQVRKRPDSIAVVDEKGSLTYSRLDLLSNALARQLIEMGVNNDDFVSVMLPRLNCFPVSYVACFKIGAGYVPIDYEYPIDRIQYMVSDSSSKVLITTKDIYNDKCKEGDLHADNIIFMDNFSSESDVSVNRSCPENLAYMIYTSGTTGKPKGVMIEHRNLSNLVHWVRDMENMGPDSKNAVYASFSFDASIVDLMAPLCFGGQVHILSSDIRKNLSGMYSYFSENKIDGIIFPTQIGLTMLKMFNLKLRYIIVGGEKMTGKYTTSAQLYNAYGPTEFTVASSYYQIDTNNFPDNIPIGKAVPNTISAIVDLMGRPLPKGVAGELVLIGSQLARGYWNREDITSEKFTACPFIEGEKMYHTGDLVRWDENGDLLYEGRIDKQIKLRGFRIELGEVESTITKYPGIISAVASIKEIAGTQHLCAYYCSTEQISDNDLRKFCSTSLTEYMVPTAFTRLEAMPMTPNGKVDTKALPVPEIKAEEIIAPETEIEKILFNLVSEVLGTKEFGVTSNLVSLGLTSLGAISLSLQIEKKLNMSVSSSYILSHPAIREWTQNCHEKIETITPFPIQKEYPLTDNQISIYIDWENHKFSTQYNVPILLKFPDTKADDVKNAVQMFIKAHPYIKTIFRSKEGKILQLRQTELEIDIPVTELATTPEKDYFQNRIRPFDLFTGPLCRFEIFTSGQDSYLLSDFHHIIFDGGSEKIFTDDIIDALEGRIPEEETFSAYDYSLYYDNWKQTEEFSKAGNYFSSLLQSSVSVSLPSSANRPTTECNTISFKVDRALERDLCKKTGVTENVFFLTAITEVLHRLTREDNISILTVSNGRSLSVLENATGMFVQTLPVVSHSTQRTISDALQGMQKQLTETIERDKYPFTKIIENSSVKTNILVAYQGDLLSSELTANGNKVEFSYLTLNTAKIPISIAVYPSKEEVLIQIEYDLSLFDLKVIQLFADAITAFVSNMAGSAENSLIGGVACVDAEQTKKLIEAGSGEQLDVDLSKTIVQHVHKWAVSNPDSISVVDSDSRITYAQLDKMSDVLAAKLRKYGISKDKFVALMLPRRKEFCISFMAVFKSGGGYVPLDYEYPAERLQYMLDDSEAKVLITTHDVFSNKNLRCNDVIYIEDIDFDTVVPAVDYSCSDGIAYMIYTSGTTGKPKGVMIEHHSLTNLIGWIKNTFEIEIGTRIMSHPSFSFDASIIDLMGSLSNGGELHILEESLRKDPEMIYRYLCDNRIQTMCISTQLGMMLMSSYKLPIRYMMVGGEKLSGKYDNGVTLINGYGPTEFTVCSSYYSLDSKNIPDNIPIGKAVPNTISAIVDSYGNLLPYGAEGELVLLGPQLARGYWNKNEITAKRFVESPFLPGQKMYHTGDLACWNEDGYLQYSGRIDTQVKLRGFRIELGEIETAIASFPGIKTSVATVKEIGTVQHLCAYFTSSGKIDTSSLKVHISKSLTGYMVPDFLMQLESMPLTPNGKVDTKALPVPENAGSNNSSSVFEVPDGEKETTIANIFSEVLGTTEPVSRNSSFFEMGGTSLLVMKLIVKFAEKGINLKYSDVFKYATPRALAAFSDGLDTAAEAQQVSSVSTTKDDLSVPSAIGSDGYDYSEINRLLSSNTIKEIPEPSKLRDHSLGDVLLLGATGYLGIHILNQLLSDYEGKIYCLIRNKKGVTPEGRLRSYLMYYFDNTYSSLFNKRLFVIEGDMTEDSVTGKLLAIKVDTVINCAANVKHFAEGDEIDKINLGGVQRIIDYCLKSGSRLIQTSTHSVSGQSKDSACHILTENSLYIGQTLMTKYQTSKFLAERAILEARGKGLKAKIMRLGNLMSRNSDGEFQINFENNGFLTRMRAYYLIGCIASSHLHSAVEFAPIDETASAILTLACTDDKFTVFHPFNNHNIYIDDVFAIMRKCGLNMKIVSDEEFSRHLNECLHDEKLNPYTTTLLAYGSHNNYTMNVPSLDFTVNVLNAMDWRWPITGEHYLVEAFEKLKELSFFELL